MLDLVSKVKSYCDENNLLRFDSLVVGLSGGPDSVALIHILKSIYNGQIIAIHVNHHLRPGDCEKDALLVEKLCRELDIPLEVYDFDVKKYADDNSLSLEEAGRKLRYKTFKSVMEQNNNSAICVAHHSGDVSETMLMNLFRGTGLEGLVSPKCEADRIIRPLLMCSKKELLDYLEQNNISYAIDKTNFDSDTTRNYWRNEILPAISNVSIKRPEEALISSYELLKDDLDFIETETGKFYEENILDNRFLPVSELKSAHISISSRALRMLWMNQFGNLTDFEKVNLKLCIDAIKAGKNIVLDMPFERKFFISNDYCGYETKDLVEDCLDRITALRGFVLSKEQICVNICDENAIKLPNVDILIKTEIIENISDLAYNNYSWFLPISEAANLSIKNDLGGLNFIKAGSQGHKVIRRIFTDMKVSECSRKKIVGIVRDDEVLFIPGIGHSKGFINQKSYQKYLETNGASGPFLKITIGGN